MKSNANYGDYVEVHLTREIYEGVLLESPDVGIVLLKLDNGYNIGFNKKDVVEIKLIEKYEKDSAPLGVSQGGTRTSSPSRSERRPRNTELMGKPNIAMVITGGTIAARLNPRKGGVDWLDSPESLFKFYPGLFDKVNVLKVEVPFMKASEDMDFIRDDPRYSQEDLENFFIHWSESARIERNGAVMNFDGSNTILTGTTGQTFSIDRHNPGVPENRVVIITWEDFYYIFNWEYEGYWDYLEWRVRDELGIDYGDEEYFDGYFQDVFNGPMSDIFDGMVDRDSGHGGIEEFDDLNGFELTSSGDDMRMMASIQSEMSSRFPEAVFMPNSGNYVDLESEHFNVIMNGDGTFTEATAGAVTTVWDDLFNLAEAIADEEKYFSIHFDWDLDSIPGYRSYWEGGQEVPIFDDIPETYPGFYYGDRWQDSQERLIMHSAALYWLAYQPGYTAFAVPNACCAWNTDDDFDVWFDVLEVDIGEPIGDYNCDISGTSEDWNWELCSREYTGGSDGKSVTVYFRGNSAWRNGNNKGLPGYDFAGASFDIPSGSHILREDGTWDYISSNIEIEHYDSFGFVVKNP
ncbi:hypothetical protein ACFL0X_01735 [Nanoarchaeota archaeon]